MSGNNSNTQPGGLAQIIASVQQVIQNFARMASSAQMFNARMRSLSLEVRGPRTRNFEHLPLYRDVPPAIQNTVESLLAKQKASGKALADAATAFAQGLIQWTEQMKQGASGNSSQGTDSDARPVVDFVEENSTPASPPALDEKMSGLEAEIGAAQQQFDATERSIQNLHDNSHWWDMDSNSLIDQYTQDAHQLDQKLSQLRDRLKLFQTAKATQGLPADQQDAIVRAAYGPEWLEYYRQLQSLGLDEKGPYWQLGEDARKLDGVLTNASIAGLTLIIPGFADESASGVTGIENDFADSTPITSDAELPDAGGPGAAEGLAYEPNRKHPPAGTIAPGTRRIGPQPTNPQQTLNTSVPFEANNPDRVAVDPETGEFIVFREHIPARGIYHGYAVTWKQLNQAQKNALIESGQVTVKGKIK